MRPDERDVRRRRAPRARAGLRTGLVSNSWGEEGYDRTRFDELFDAVVISGEIGIRKPAPEIYALAAERLGRAPERCVFVDDLAGNLKPARAIGMATVLHRDAERRSPSSRSTSASACADRDHAGQRQPDAQPPACALTRSARTKRASTTVTAG